MGEVLSEFVCDSCHFASKVSLKIDRLSLFLGTDPVWHLQASF